MAITKKEKSRVEKHALDETKFEKDDFIYLSPSGFDSKSAIKEGVNSTLLRPMLMLLNIPQAIVIGLLLFFMRYAIFSYPGYISAMGCSNCSANTFLDIMIGISAAVGFVLYEILISSQIGAYYKTRLANVKKAGILDTAISELSIAQPFSYLLFACAIMLLYLSLVAAILAFIVGIALYFASINQSLLPYALSKGSNMNRSSAIAWGWIVLSNFSVKLARTNIMIFLPFIAVVIAFVASGSLIALLALMIVFVPSQAIWYGATTNIYQSSKKSKKIMNLP